MTDSELMDEYKIILDWHAYTLHVLNEAREENRIACQILSDFVITHKLPLDGE